MDIKEHQIRAVLENGNKLAKIAGICIGAYLAYKILSENWYSISDSAQEILIEASDRYQGNFNRTQPIP
ncbi:MAG: hypothetical protein HY831_00605 [Candidatus Aenigmarchaeota archaeon]|nr:hypothetical protein [Candidatus Aenigmarchaeota archaeon]